MARINLTTGRIRNFGLPDGSPQAFLRDAEVGGLAVRATPGTKAFVFQSKIGGRDLRITIGDVGTWTLEDARVEARRLQTLIDQGIDPRHEKAERLAATAAKHEQDRKSEAPAMEAWNAYVEARRVDWGEWHLKNHSKFSQAGGEPRTRGRRPGEPSTTQPGPLYPLLSRPLNEIDAEAVRAWLSANVATRPTWTAQAYRALRAFIGWCAEHPEYRHHTHADACTQKQVRAKVPAPRSKDDCLQREQLALWFEHVRKLPNPIVAAYLQTLLLTGARREELAGLRWEEDVDFQWKSLTIRDKVDGTRTIPLPPYVAGLLRDLKARSEIPPPQPRKLRQSPDEEPAEWEPSPWVFASPSAAGGRIAGPNIAHRRALIAAGLPHVSLHGLRRSFGTLSEWVEVPVGVVAQIQGHKPSAIAERHYRKRPLDLLRLWHVRIEAWILEQAGIEQPRTDVSAPALKVVD